MMAASTGLLRMGHQVWASHAYARGAIGSKQQIDTSGQLRLYHTLSENVGLEDCVFFFFVGHASATIPRGWLNSFAREVTEYAY